MGRALWWVAPACFIAAGVCPTTFSQEKEPAKKDARKQVMVGRNVFVEIENKKVARVLVQAKVCLRQGSLEHLLTRRRCKEHEAILTADIDARDLHTALLLTGLKAGTPVVFEPKEIAPSGPAVKITLTYKKDGKEVKVPAQKWIRHAQNEKRPEARLGFRRQPIRWGEGQPGQGSLPRQ